MHAMIMSFHHLATKVDKNTVELVMTNKVKLVLDPLDQNSVVDTVEVVDLMMVTEVVPVMLISNKGNRINNKMLSSFFCICNRNFEKEEEMF